jgi:hypothetical protein
LLGEEIRPTEDKEDRIDLLGIDKDGSAVILELRRGTQKLHLLQALGYAAMVSKWDLNRFIEEYSQFSEQSLEKSEQDLQEFLDEDAVINSIQRVILLAEEFDYEVLVTAEWLIRKYDLDIRCIRLALSAESGGEFLNCTCIYPPPEITEQIRLRGSRRGARRIKWTSWGEAIDATSRSETSFEGNAPAATLRAIYGNAIFVTDSMVNGD